jgi:hypothetical protein
MGRENQNETKDYRMDGMWSDGCILEGTVQLRFVFPIRGTVPCAFEVVEGERQDHEKSGCGKEEIGKLAQRPVTQKADVPIG